MERFTDQMKREFLRGVAFFINDPITFQTFACSSSMTYDISKEFVPYKKKEFTKYEIHDVYVFPVLPNGDIHGVHEFGDILIECNNGILRQERIISDSEGYGRPYYNIAHFKFTRHLVIKTYLYRFQNVPILLINQRTDRQITALLCDACNRYHTYQGYGDTNSYILRWNCLGGNRTIITYNNNNIFDRRGQIAFKVIQYAKQLK